MPSKAIVLFLLIASLSLCTKVSSSHEDDVILDKPPIKTPSTAGSPVTKPPGPPTTPATPVTKPPGSPSPPLVKQPTPAPPVAKPPAPSPPVYKPPTPSPPVVKPPTPSPPVVKPPTPSPPVVKPPTPSPPVYKPPTPSPPVSKPPTPVVPPVKPPTAPLKPPVVKTRADCIPLCGERCKLHSRQGLCTRACITCCDRCKCVPPGTYGNKEVCGKCYTEMLTRRNRPKCP